MSAPLLYLTGITLTFGGTPLLTGADLYIRPRDRIALTGRNGSGKSTLMKIAAGMTEPDTGERFAHPGATIQYLQQNPVRGKFANLREWLQSRSCGRKEQGQAAALLEELALDPDSALSGLSGGEWRRAAIAGVLFSRPDILFLDEPTNHLDLSTIIWLEKKLCAMQSAMIVISHDRRFLETVSTRTVWLDRGRTRALHRGFAAFENWRDTLLEEEQVAARKLGRKIAAEENWLRYGVTARRKRNMRRLGNLESMRDEWRNRNEKQQQVRFSPLEQGHPAKRIITAENISKSFGGRTVVSSFSTEIAKGDRIGIIGPNGSGKTTLVNLLSGRLAPDSGYVRSGDSISTLFLDQEVRFPDPRMRVTDAVGGGGSGRAGTGAGKMHITTYLNNFLFTKEQFHSPVSALSGGEKKRLMLAALLMEPSSLLILDEPTNDLDLETLEVFQETLSTYEGALLLVSHDRSFLNALVRSVIVADPENPGVWNHYAGGYDDIPALRGSFSGTGPQAGKRSRPVKKPAGKNRQNRSPGLSYKERYALEKLPEKIACLEKTVEKLKKTLADPELFGRDRACFENTVKDLEKAAKELEDSEEEWIRLETRREELL